MDLVVGMKSSWKFIDKRIDYEMAGIIMSDFHQSGVITTFHNLRTQSIEQQEQEIQRFAKKSPISLIFAQSLF